MLRKTISAALAVAVTATSLLAGSVPASAQRGDRMERERYVERYCSRNPRDRDCRDFSVNRKRWSDDRYRSWYRSHGRNDAGAAAIFGLAAGAIIGGAIAAGNAGHAAACEARYRSYDRRTDTYIGAGGRRYRCDL